MTFSSSRIHSNKFQREYVYCSALVKYLLCRRKLLLYFIHPNRDISGIVSLQKFHWVLDTQTRLWVVVCIIQTSAYRCHETRKSRIINSICRAGDILTSHVQWLNIGPHLCVQCNHSPCGHICWQSKDQGSLNDHDFCLRVTSHA